MIDTHTHTHTLPRFNAKHTDKVTHESTGAQCGGVWAEILNGWELGEDEAKLTCLPLRNSRGTLISCTPTLCTKQEREKTRARWAMLSANHHRPPRPSLYSVHGPRPRAGGGPRPPLPLSRIHLASPPSPSISHMLC